MKQDTQIIQQASEILQQASEIPSEHLKTEKQQQ